MWLALAGWTAELAALLLRKYVGQSMRLVYPAATLLGPVTYLVLFLAATLALLAIRRLAGRWLRARFEVGVLTTLCALAVVAVFAGTLGRLPWLLLSLGIGVQSMRLITSKPTGFQRLISWSTIPLLAIAVIAGPGWYVWTLAKERTGLVGLPTARAGVACGASRQDL